MKIQPMGDRILIRIMKLQEQNVVKGVFIPEHVTIGGSVGVAEVVGLGQGYMSNDKISEGQTTWDPLETKIGERILFNSKAGIGLSKKYRLIRESEIVAKICDAGIDIGNELLSGDEN